MFPDSQHTSKVHQGAFHSAFKTVTLLAEFNPPPHLMIDQEKLFTSVLFRRFSLIHKIFTLRLLGPALEVLFSQLPLQGCSPHFGGAVKKVFDWCTIFTSSPTKSSKLQVRFPKLPPKVRSPQSGVNASYALFSLSNLCSCVEINLVSHITRPRTPGDSAALFLISNVLPVLSLSSPEGLSEGRNLVFSPRL